MGGRKNFQKALTVVAIVALSLSRSHYVAAEGDQSQNLRYSQWTKVCIDNGDADLRGCLTGREGRSDNNQPVIAAVVADGQSNPLVRLQFPLGMQLMHGTRLIIDNNPPVQAPYVGCTKDGCVSDYELTSDLRAELSRGQTMIAQAINTNGSPLSFSVPLAGLDDALSGPAKGPAEIARSRDDAKDRWPSFGYLADPRAVLLSERGGVGAANLVSLNYIPWTKFCLKSQDGSARQVCFTGKDGRIASGMAVVAAVMIEPEGDPKKILRVTLPIGVQLVPGTRVLVDNAAPLVNPFVLCFANGCMADYEATSELIGDLMTGRTLVVQAINGDGAQLSLELPLQEGGGAGFAKARNGPPTDPKVYQQTQQKLQAEWASKAKPAQASPASSSSHPGARPSGH